jgi:hypothetical protein
MQGLLLKIGTSHVTEKYPVFIESEGALPCSRISPFGNHPAPVKTEPKFLQTK